LTAAARFNVLGLMAARQSPTEHQKPKIGRLTWLLAGWLCASAAAPIDAEITPLRPKSDFTVPESGESVVYQASWNGIPVASAVLEAGPVILDGKRHYRVEIQAKSWKYLDLVWKMRDSIESVFDLETLHPRRFVLRQRENSKSIDTTARFDPQSNTWLVHRRQGRKIRNYDFVSRDTLDPVSATYLARRLDFIVGDTLRMEVFGGKSRYEVLLDIVGKERITLKNGDYDAYRIIPRVRNISRGGYAGRVRQATLWVSADEWRRPLRMVSQVFVGNVNIEMVDRNH
jgi:hypothetical protein